MEKRISISASLKVIVAQLKQYKTDTIMAPCLSVCEGICETLIPFFMASLIDDGIEASNMGQIYKYGLIIVGVAAVALACGVFAGLFASRASAGFACNLRDAMFSTIQTYSFSNIDKFSTAGLITRMTTDVTNVQNAFQMLIRMCARVPVSMISAFVLSVIISRRLSLMFVIAIIFLAVILSFIMTSTFSIFNYVFDQYDNLNASVQENVSGIRVVKSFVREEYEDEKYSKESNRLYSLFVKAESRLSFNNPAMLLTVYSCNLALSWLGAHMIVQNQLTTGQLTSLFSYVMNILSGLMMFSNVFVQLAMCSASARRIGEVLTETTDLPKPKDPVYVVPDGSVDFNDVDFQYLYGKGDPVLKDINLHVKSGETIGIIGGTGSSKSSLVQLIPRLYDATSGSVMVGGINVKDYNLDALRNEVSMVLQNNVLFSGTIYDNLRWGDENATDEECRHACELACADDFISAFPDGYNTYIEQGGTNVSGGQKQRLCIARALLKKPKILILDDSTSAVDTATDAKIRRAFREEIPGTTKFIIAQRISSVEDADRIIVMDEGRINGIGTHEELLETNKIYQEVYRGQIEGGGDFDIQGGEG